jgi:hypothetical protein
MITLEQPLIDLIWQERGPSDGRVVMKETYTKGHENELQLSDTVERVLALVLRA